MHSNLEAAVAAHYGRSGLVDAITEGLATLGVAPEAATPETLAPVDEFHTAGRAATLKVLERVPLRPGMHVLDAGCGLGGTARSLAREHGCRVTGLDLTPEYVAAARLLSERMGLAGECDFREGSVLAMPFADETFDAAVTFHVAMNIDDRDRFYGELARVLRPGAPLAVFDVMKGPAAGMVYPVPWAETEATSFLRSPAETHDLLSTAGFAVTAEESLRDFAIGYFREVFARMAEADGPPPLGLHLLVGANGREKFANYVAALEAHQIDPVVMIAEKA